MANTPKLVPDSQFPELALEESIQKPPTANLLGGGGMVFTWTIASAADSILPWGRNVAGRDRQLRDFWPTETYLAGGLASVSFRNATLDWEVQNSSERVAQVETEKLNSAIAGDTFGWVQFIEKFSQDLYTQDNGAFVEIIRDPGLDASSKFKNERAPCIGIAHMDSNKCIRTGDPETPVLYTDRNGKIHKLKWYQVIAFSDYPSAIETMNGVGYCAVTRALRMAQIARSIFIFKDEKISGRHFKQMHFVSGVSRQDIKDEMVRGQEEANNSGMIRFMLPAILASLDPEKPVSTATIDLASLPDGFSFDEEMKWYISGLSLAFGVDYQEFAPLPGGNIGSASQSMILHRKSSGKSPAVFMRKLTEGFKNYGILSRGSTLRFNDKDEQEELERQEVRTAAMEEVAISVRSGILTPDAARKDLVARGIYDQKTIEGIPEDYGNEIVAPSKNPVGQTGGNTIREDANRNTTGKEKQKAGARLRKMFGG
ncbi:MAG: hypothetical protein EHM33_27295 [Chloroflexi bacterium]|nr:MAG: hypothetical protein EHM33_27295 [Chloroflexota bacterium]